MEIVSSADFFGKIGSEFKPNWSNLKPSISYFSEKSNIDSIYFRKLAGEKRKNVQNKLKKNKFSLKHSSKVFGWGLLSKIILTYCK